MIKRKYSVNKLLSEKNSQQIFFGRDNLQFKLINRSKKQNLYDICKDFKLKKFIKNISIYLPIIKIYKV